MSAAEEAGAMRLGAWMRMTGGSGTWRDFLVWLSAQHELHQAHAPGEDFTGWVVARAQAGERM